MFLKSKKLIGIFSIGNIEAALDLANKLLTLKPKDKEISKAKTIIMDIIDGKSKKAKKYNKKKEEKKRKQQQEVCKTHIHTYVCT